MKETDSRDRLSDHHHDTNTTLPIVTVTVLPYEMCPRDECTSRVRTKEISMYERPSFTTSPSSSSSSSLSFDPCKVITKYRRSVAAVSIQGNNKTIRSPSSLATTIQYLMHHIYIRIVHQSSSFRSKLEFIEDRIRAVQVELVQQQASSSLLSSSEMQTIQKTIQYNITKYYIITLYIMSEDANTAAATTTNQCKYETTFAQRALQTSIYSYLNYIETTATTTSSSNSSKMMDDEMMAYFLLTQFNQQLLQQSLPQNDDEYSTFWYNVTESYRKLTSSSSLDDNAANQLLLLQQPFTRYVLDIIRHYVNGQYQTALQMIRYVASSSSRTTDSSSYYTTGDWRRFRIVLRCSLAATYVRMRYQIITVWNRSARPNEVVPLPEVARLLCYHHHRHHHHPMHGHPNPSNITTTTTTNTATKTLNETNGPLSSSPPLPSLGWQECYQFCQMLQVPLTSSNTTKDDGDGHDPLVRSEQLSHVGVIFKVNAIPSLDQILQNATACRVRTMDMEQSLFTRHDDDDDAAPTTYTSSDGVVVPTPEWFYKNHIFF